MSDDAENQDHDDLPDIIDVVMEMGKAPGGDEEDREQAPSPALPVVADPLLPAHLENLAGRARAYVEAHLADPAFRRWRAMSLFDGDDRPEYFYDNPRRAWPGPVPLPARAIESGTPENAVCPYSGGPVDHLLETGGRVFGFGSAFDRDKTAADPDAWPEFVRMLS